MSEVVFGRTRVARAARFVTNQVRLDLPNDLHSNGERLVQQIVSARASDPIVIFDVGAHYGRWSESLLSFDNSAAIYAFEPSGYSYTELTRRLAKHSNVTCERIAFSHRGGESLMHIVHQGAGTNSLVPSRFGAQGETEKVIVRTLDDYCASQGIGHITLLKCDAEGHDLAVLRGGMELLKHRAIEVVQFEYNHLWIDDRSFLADVFEILTPLGYSFGKVTPRGIEFYKSWHHELETFREANFIACTGEWVDRFPHIRWWNE